MNQVPGPLSSASHCLAVLEGGRSPGHWRQEMSRRIAPLGAIQQNSSWVCELASIDLRLSNHPLLGETLSVLTSRNTVTNAAPDEPEVTQKPFSESTPTRKRELKAPGDLNSSSSLLARPLVRQDPEPKRAVLSPATSHTPEPAEAVLRLPPQVDTSFLRRIAGDISHPARDGSDFATETESAGVKRHAARPNKVAEHSKHHQLPTLTTLEKSGSRSAVIQPPAPVAAQVDQAELTRSVQRAVRRIEATFQRRSLITHFSPAAVIRGRVLPIDLQSLADHWSIPINGPTASVDILRRLASSVALPDRDSRSDVERESARSNSTGNESSPVVVESSPGRSRQTSASSAVHQSRKQPLPGNTHAPRSLSSQVHDTADNIASRVFSELPMSETSEAERWSGLVPDSAQPVHLLIPATAPAIAPPTLTPSLPPLHSDKADDVILPVAAATAQRQARFEEEIARGEDLTLLAERIERILKQEARRHGIDV